MRLTYDPKEIRQWITGPHQENFFREKSGLDCRRGRRRLGAGAWFGLHRFDDAVSSDRRVWTSAIIGAVAGGVAGGVLSWNIVTGPRMPPYRMAWPDRAPVLPPLNLLHNPPDLIEEVEDKNHFLALLRGHVRRFADRDAQPVGVQVVGPVPGAGHNESR